jgi:glutathione S-transferase
MKLIGMLDSPYVRRTAICMKLLGIAFEHEALSVFRHFDVFSQVNPVVKAPTLVFPDGQVLMDSGLILTYAEAIAAPEKRLLPAGGEALLRVLMLNGLALAACEKTMQIVYEQQLRPVEKQHQPWYERVKGQLDAAYGALEKEVLMRAPSLIEGEINQASVTVAVAWGFSRLMLPEIVLQEDYPGLQAFSENAEKLGVFLDTAMV